MNETKGTSQTRPAVAASATEIFGRSVPSEAWSGGRRLVLKFMGTTPPDLDCIEFQAKANSVRFHRQKADPLDKDCSFKASPAAQAFAIFFLDHLCARLQSPPRKYILEGEDSSVASTLGYAIDNKNGKWGSLFQEKTKTERTDENGEPHVQTTVSNRVDKIFGGKNFGGKPAKQRLIYVLTDYLADDCFEIYWNDQKLDGLEQIGKLRDAYRAAWKLPPPKELELPVPEPPKAPPAPDPIPTKPETSQEREVPQKPRPIPRREEKKASRGEAKGNSAQPARDGFQPVININIVNNAFPPSPETKAVPTGKDEPKKAEGVTTRADSPRIPKSSVSQGGRATPPGTKVSDLKFGIIDVEFKTQETERPKPIFEPPPPPPKINPMLFEIVNPCGYEWDEQMPLMNFGNQGSEADVWRVRDASEGVLILGGVGSGKTSGSGSAFAINFLAAGYGGLVMTAKPDEAQRWIRLCQRANRTQDCIHITQDCIYRLNILQYEAERPGRRPSRTDDLVALFRCLIGVASGSSASKDKGDFWSNAGDRLMGRLFDVFLLAGEPMVLNSLISFVESAPADPKDAWDKEPYFADVMNRARAKAVAGDDDDRMDFQKSFDYWTRTYPQIAPDTRSGIITGFTSMAEILNGRGIRTLVSSGTNITPEQILSGKIVILDLPVKESIKGGLMVQSAWKLLFQQAVERRADKGQSSARPVFLWEDEGHEFFSQHDVRFQPTARDCRVSHVIMSQNLHNFLHLGHDSHAVEAVFAAMNTCVFHTNVDTETNRWAAERIGQEKTPTLKSAGLFHDVPNDEISFFASKRPDETKSVGGFRLGEEIKYAVRPEEFSRLKRGGDGTCEAVVHWLSHRFEANHHRNFIRVLFDQEQR